MNRHFEDALYYLKRAGETAKRGVAKEVSPIEEKVREVTGQEAEPDPSRLEGIRSDLKAVQEKAIGQARGAVGKYRPGKKA